MITDALPNKVKLQCEDEEPVQPESRNDSKDKCDLL